MLFQQPLPPMPEFVSKILALGTKNRSMCDACQLWWGGHVSPCSSAEQPAQSSETANESGD
jgi:hypothetical protein